MRLSVPAGLSRIDEVLRADHVALETSFRRLLSHLRGGSQRDVQAEWHRLRGEVATHLRFEEDHLLPSFANTFPEAAAHIRAEHRQIGAALDQLSRGVPRRDLCPEQTATFVRLIRQHARFEDRMFYSWAELELEGRDGVPVQRQLRLISDQ